MSVLLRKIVEIDMMFVVMEDVLQFQSKKKQEKEN